MTASSLLTAELSEGSVVIDDLDFGSVQFGTTYCLDVTIANNASLPVTFDVVESDEQFSLESGTLPLTLMPGESREIGVCFTPDAYGRISGELALRSTSTELRVVSALTGTGVDGPTSVEERVDRSSSITWMRSDNSLRVGFPMQWEIEEVRLYSLTGELLSGARSESTRSGQVTLDLPESLASGVYYLVVSETNGTEPILIRISLN